MSINKDKARKEIKLKSDDSKDILGQFGADGAKSALIVAIEPKSAQVAAKINDGTWPNELREGNTLFWGLGQYFSRPKPGERDAPIYIIYFPSKNTKAEVEFFLNTNIANINIFGDLMTLTAEMGQDQALLIDPDGDYSVVAQDEIMPLIEAN